MKLTKSEDGTYWTLDLKSLERKAPMKTPKAKKTKTWVELGKIMLAKVGAKACLEGYKMSDPDPEWIGRYALQYGDINRDGTLN